MSQPAPTPSTGQTAALVAAAGPIVVAQFAAVIGFGLGGTSLGVAGGAIGLGAALYLGRRSARREIGRILERLLHRLRPLVPTPAAAGGSVHALIDELEAQQKLLADERAHFETVLRSLDEGVIVLDGARTVVMLNPSAEELLGIHFKAVGQRLFEVSRAPALNDLVNRAPDASGEIEFDVVRALPKVRHLLARVSFIEATGERLIVLRDVTRRRRLERMRRDFVANASHEMKTPLSVLQAASENLQRMMDKDRPEAKYVESIHRNALRMGALITDLLELAQLESGSYGLSVGPVSVADAVHQTREALAPRVDAAEAELTVDLPELPPIQADLGALERALINLVDNALKYGRPSGGHVRIRATPAGAHIRIEVEDDGPGIEARHRSRLFERFYRVDAGRSRAQGGTGLGLAIVKHLIELQGGETGYRPADPGGSVFWLSLPVAPPETGA